jgi:hypothetical protein
MNYESTRPSRSAWKDAILYSLLGVSIAVTVVAAAIGRSKLSTPEMSAQWKACNHILILIIFAASALSYLLIGAHKTWLVIKTMKIRISYREALLLHMGTSVFRFLLPFQSGELVKMTYLCRRRHVRFGYSAGIVIFDRCLDLVGAATWLVLGIVLAGTVSIRWELMLIAGVAAAYGTFLFSNPMHRAIIASTQQFSHRLGHLLTGLLSPLQELTFGEKIFFIGYGAIVQLFPILIVYSLFLTFGATPDPETFLVNTSISLFARCCVCRATATSCVSSVIVLFPDSAPAHVMKSISHFMNLAVYIAPMLACLPAVPWILASIGKQHIDDR